MLNGQGRVQLYGLELGAHTIALVYNIYGWTNAARNKEAAERTHSLLDAVLQDAQKYSQKGLYYLLAT